VVPKSNSKRDRDRVRRQACAARDFCGVAGGPPGFHLIGSGPLDGANRAPAVDAGPDQAIDLGATASLQGVVTDDGLPSGALTLEWSRVEGQERDLRRLTLPGRRLLSRRREASPPHRGRLGARRATRSSSSFGD
jgi:hypothetical protein